MGDATATLARAAGLHPRVIDLSLGRIERLLGALGDPHLRLPPTIHVAGTNGKGSTVAFMRAALEASGARVHVYTSPHLVRFNERIRLAGRLIDDERLADALERCERANAGGEITVFEIATAAAFLAFSEAPADWLLLEVGLGGRLDATNVIPPPAAAAIAPVSIDHVEFLGSTLAEIAREKAGILKRGAPAVAAVQPREAREAIDRAAARAGVRVAYAGEDFHAREENGRLVYEDSAGLLDLPPPRLAGRHQIGNAALAIAALRAAGAALSARDFERGMAEAQWPARLQRLSGGPLSGLAPAGAEVWLDGGHNPDGGRALAEAMADLEDRAPRGLALVCGTLATKDATGFLKPFAGLAREVLAVPLGADHAGRPAEDTAAAARAAGMPAAAFPGVAEALRFLAARREPVPPRILIAGSLYLAGDVLAAEGRAPD